MLLRLFLLAVILFAESVHAPPTPALPIGWEQTTTGILRHLKSGVILPSSLDGTLPTKVEDIELETGDSASVSYENESKGQLITFYIYTIYKAPFDPEVQFKTSVAFALENRRDAQVVEADHGWMGKPPRRIASAYYAALMWSKHDRQQASWIVVATHGSWYVKVLTTAPLTDSGKTIGHTFNLALRLLQDAEFGPEQ